MLLEFYNTFDILELTYKNHFTRKSCDHNKLKRCPAFESMFQRAIGKLETNNYLSCTSTYRLITNFTTEIFTKCRKCIQETNVMFCAIWYHLYNLKNVKNTHGGVLLLVKLQAKSLALLHGCFSRVLNCTNGTKSRKA